MKAMVGITVRGDFGLQALEVWQEIAMSQDDAPRLGSGAGGEENLCDMVASDGLVGKRLVHGRGRLVRVVMSRDAIGLLAGVGSILRIQRGGGRSEVRLASARDAGVG